MVGKSILARIQSLREKGFDESDGTKINQVAKSLNSVGIQLTDKQGQFRDFGKVMDELGAKWGSLDSRHRAYIATTVAGTYQQSRFLDLMQGYSRSVDLYNQSLDSAGTTQSKFNEWQQGTEAQIAKLTNTIQAFWMSAFNSKDIQLAIGGLNSIVSGLKTLNDTFGFLPTTLGLVTAGLLTFNGKIKTAFQGLVANVKTSVTEFNVLSTSLVRTGDAMLIGSTRSKVLQTGLYNLTLAGRGASIAFNAIATSIKGFAISLATTALPVAAIMLVSAGIEKLTEYISNQKAQEEALQKQQQNLVDSYSNHKTKINDLAKSYEELSNVRSTVGLTNDQEQQYVDVQNQLAKLLPTVKAGEDAKSNAILQSSSAINDQIKLLQKQIDLEKQKKNLDAPKQITDNVSKVTNLEKELETNKKNAEYYAGVVAESEKHKLNHAQILWEMQQENDWQLKQANSQNQINSNLQKNATLIKGYFDGSKIDSTSITEVSTALSHISLKGKDMGEVDTLFKSIANSVNKLNTAFKDDDKKGIQSAEKSLESLGVKGDILQVILQSIINAQNKNSKAAKDGSSAMAGEALTVDQLTKKLSDAKGSFSDTKDAIMSMIKSQEFSMAVSATQGQLYTEMSDKLSPVNKLLEDMANGQTLSASAAMDLIQKVPEMTKYLTIQNGQVQINTQGIIDWRNAQVTSFQDAINAEKAQIDVQSTGLKTKLANYGIEIKAILSVADANKALAEAQDQYNKKVNSMNNSPDAMHASMIGGQKSLDDQYKGLTDGINSIKDAYDSLDQLSSMASTGLSQVGTSLDKTSSSTQKSTYVTDQYKNSIDELNTALDKLKSLQQKYPQYSQAYRDALTAENKLLQQQKDLTDAQIKNLQTQIATGNIIQTGMISGSSSSGSGSSSNYNYASGGSTEAQIWNFLKGKGLSDSAIAGIMGNLQVESSFNTQALGPVTKYGRPQGIAQWLGSRLSALQSQPNWTSLDTQLNFLWSEWSRMMPGNFNGLSASQAATTFESLFERSGGSLNSKRISNANSILSQFAGSGGTYSGGLSGTDNSAANQAQAVDQAKSQLLQLQSQEQQYVDQIQANLLEIVNSTVAQFDHAKSQIDADLAKIDYNQNVVSEYSVTWRDLEVQREIDYGKQINLEKQSIDYLNQQIQTNNQLTEAQKATLSDQVLQRQQDIISLEQKIYDQRVQMANETIDTYKKALSTMKDAATKTIDDEINAINKASDQASYQKKLSDAQKSAQDIQTQINQLSLDDSYAAKKKIADLKTQLTSQQDSITQMIADNDKQQRIDNLNTQKQALSDYYDNMINDETKFAQMRSNIIADNTLQIYNDLQSFSKQIQANVKILGTGVVNTIIAAINKVNGYIGDNQLSPIASLDSGGLLPSWGSGGKMLMAHEKEMVLNKTDTSNVLKIVNVARDFFSNVVKLPDLSGLKLNTATSSGDTVYQFNFKVDKMMATKGEADSWATKIVNGIKSKGGSI